VSFGNCNCWFIYLTHPPTSTLPVNERAFPAAASRSWNSQPLHVTSAPYLQTFRKRYWSRLCSAAVSRLVSAATLFLA